MMMTLEQAKREYSAEWIAFVVEEEGEELSQLKGYVLEHDRDRRELHRKLREKKIEMAYVTFAGPLIRPGYSVMF